MKPVSAVSGRALPLARADVDTDQIVPSEALKNIGRSGFGRYLFGEWREDPDFVLNDPRFEGAVILVAGANFGCGSSREHAPWALADYGFRAVIAPSFADIFKNNCAKIGLLTVELPQETVEGLLELVAAEPTTLLRINVETRWVSGGGLDLPFPLDDFARHRLLEGLDDIGLTLARRDEIAAFEAGRPGWLPKI